MQASGTVTSRELRNELLLTIQTLTLILANPAMWFTSVEARISANEVDVWDTPCRDNSVRPDVFVISSCVRRNIVGVGAILSANRDFFHIPKKENDVLLQGQAVQRFFLWAFCFFLFIHENCRGATAPVIVHGILCDCFYYFMGVYQSFPSTCS